MSKNIVLILFFVSILIGCSNKEPLTAEKFKILHKSIYDAWELDSEEDIKAKLTTTLTGAFLKEQLSSQSAMLQARQDAKEQHKVNSITYHELEILESNDTEAIIFTDYTIEGYRFHGDYHEQKSSHRIYWKLVYTEDGWKIEQINT